MTSQFGGTWTKQKLSILEKYLSAYTGALKKQPFRLLYIDAFAGTGEIRLKDANYSDEVEQFIKGSIDLALSVEDRSFDQFYFIEKDKQRYRELEAKLGSHPKHAYINLYHGDANEFLMKEIPSVTRKNYRGVLFLDPFATEVKWESIKIIADSEALDTWILFPTSAVARLLPKNNKPEEVSDTWKNKLNEIFGSEHWENLYSNPIQPSLFGASRDPGVKGLIKIYKENLKELLGNRFLNKSATLRGPKKSPLFEFMFFTGNPSPPAIGLSHKIARDILDGYQHD